jgi:hypothetical protein
VSLIDAVATPKYDEDSAKPHQNRKDVVSTGGGVHANGFLVGPEVANSVG